MLIPEDIYPWVHSPVPAGNQSTGGMKTRRETKHQCLITLITSAFLIGNEMYKILCQYSPELIEALHNIQTQA